MSPKDTLDFDTEDDIIELTDIVEQGSPPAMHDAADDLFDAGGGEIDFEKELEDLFSDDGDTKAPAAANDSDGLDFESDLDDLLGSLDGDDGASAPAPQKPAPSGGDDDDFSAELDDLLGGLDEPAAPAAAPKPPVSSPDPDDLLAELGLGPAPATPATPAAGDSDIDFSELDALIEDMEVPKTGKKAPAPQEDDGLPDLSDLDSLFEEAAAGDAVLSSKSSTASAPDPFDSINASDDDMDLDSLLDSLDSAIEEPSVKPSAKPQEQPDQVAAGVSAPDRKLADAHNDDLESLLGLTDELNVVDAAANAAGGDIDDIDALLDSLDTASTPQASYPTPAFDPNESLSAPDMGELDDLLEDIGLGATPAQAQEPAGDDDIPDLDDILNLADAEPATIPDDSDGLDDLDALLAGTDQASDASSGAALSESDADDIMSDGDLAADMPDGSDIDDLLQDLGDMPSAPSAISGTTIDLPDTLPLDQPIDLPDDLTDGLPDDTELDLGADPADTEEDIAEIDALIASLPDEADMDLESLRKGLEDAEACVVQEAPELAALLARITALEQQLSPSEERIEDIVARKIAETAAEDEACIAHEKPSVVLLAIEDAMADNGPIMTRIGAMIEQKLEERLVDLEKSIFTHKDWNTHSHDMKDELKANIEKAAAKAAAEIIREELSALLSEE